MSDETTSAPLHRYRFHGGAAEFDESRFELLVGGLAVEVQHKPLQLLAVLLAGAGEVVPREALISAVWGDRVTVDNVLANAVLKLRSALGDDAGDCIVTVPRRGYRIAGAIERVDVGRREPQPPALNEGDAVPGRAGFVLVDCVGRSDGGATWLARHRKTGERRIFKFAFSAERLADLKREVTVYRLLQESLGEPDGFVRLLDWDFEHPPWRVEAAYGGISLERWAVQPADATEAAGGTAGNRLAALPRAARLGLFLQAADAVSAAHGVAVLHKDLKPANFLVQRRGEGQLLLRLVDFGSARLLDPERLDALRISRLAATLPGGADADFGTPLYLAPELLTGHAPSVRSDLYALGVVLYQLLAGDLQRPLAPGWQRDIEDELLIDDIACATDVEPSMRLASVAALAERLRALDARRAERARQREAQAAVRQARQLQARATAVRPWRRASVAVLACGLIASLAFAAHQRRAADGARARADAAAAQALFLTEALVDTAHPRTGPRTDISLVEALKIAAAAIDERQAQRPAAVRAELHARMQQALSALGWPRDAAQAGERAVAAWTAAGVAADAPQLQSARLQQVADWAACGDRAAAARTLAQAEAAAGVAHRRSPLLRARLLRAGWLAAGSDRADDAPLRAAWPLVAGTPELASRWAQDMGRDHAAALLHRGAAADAETVYRQLLAAAHQHGGPSRHDIDVDRALATVGLAQALAARGRDADALALLPEVMQSFGDKLGQAHPLFLQAADLSARLNFRSGDAAGAQRQWRVVAAGWRAQAGSGSSPALTAEARHAMARHHADRDPGAEQALRDVLAQARRILGDDTPELQFIRFALADCLLDRSGRKAEAAGLLEGLSAERLNDEYPDADWRGRLDGHRRRAQQGPPPPPRTDLPGRAPAPALQTAGR